jgi:hypothetical protein
MRNIEIVQKMIECPQIVHNISETYVKKYIRKHKNKNSR